MNIKQLIKLVKTSYKVKRPVLAMSSPGAGKSSAIYQAASQLSGEYKSTFTVIECRASTSSPAELGDIKFVVDGEVRNAPQGWIPTDEKVKSGECSPYGLIFLDEIADSTPTVQSALQQLLLDRRLGSVKLAKGWGTVAASNRQADKAAAGRVSTALVNRCIVVTVNPDTDVFVEWALDNKLHPAVIAFCRWRPGCWNFDPAAKNANPAFCSPRSMHILSDLLHEDPDPDFEVITGIVGDGVGSEFSGFLRIMNDLPSIPKIIKEAETHPVPQKIDVALATLYALIARADEKNVGQIVKYICRNDVEVTVVGLSDLVKRFGAVSGMQTVLKWVQEPRHRELLMGGA